MIQLFWLRTDLRIADNTALSQALSNGPTVAVYLITPQQWLAHAEAPSKVDFWLRNLVCLREQLGKFGNTMFAAQPAELQLSQAWFLPTGAINALRREATEKLELARLAAYQRPPRAEPAANPVP